LLAASGQDGLLEMDVNLNPLRTEMLAGELVPQNGFVTLNDEPGIGIEPDLSALKVWAHPVPTY
jgi:L-alanine-DL-glutamate epimerase-like enolase superfamily enzyme